MIADIYKNADSFVAWIGPETDDNALVLHYLAYLVSEVDVGWCTSSISPSHFAEAHKIRFAGLTRGLPPTTRYLDAFISLLGRSWFERPGSRFDKKSWHALQAQSCNVARAQ